MSKTGIENKVREIIEKYNTETIGSLREMCTYGSLLTPHGIECFTRELTNLILSESTQRISGGDVDEKIKKILLHNFDNGRYLWSGADAELKSLVAFEREEAIMDFYGWYMNYLSTMSSVPILEQYFSQPTKDSREECLADSDKTIDKMFDNPLEQIDDLSKQAKALKTKQKETEE